MLSEEDAGVSKSFRSQRLALVERIMLARVTGDFDYLESISAPDIVVKLVGDKALIPDAGLYRSVKEARRALENVNIEITFHNMKQEYIMLDGEQVGIRWTGTLRNRGTGASAEFEGFTHLVFENGLIKEYFALVDTASMSALARGD